MANSYSQNEQEIGTWLDGKKLYQKTYKFDLATTTWSTPYIIDISDLSYDFIEIFDGAIIESNTTWELNAYQSSSNATFTRIWKESNQIAISFTKTGSGYLTVRYTKNI